MLASLRRTAVRALGQHQPTARRDAVLHETLRDSDAHVRADAIRSIRAVRSASNLDALERARDKETVPFVRDLLDSALR